MLESKKKTIVHLRSENKLYLTNRINKHIIKSKIHITQELVDEFIDTNNKIEHKKLCDTSLVGILNGLYEPYSSLTTDSSTRICYDLEDAIFGSTD